METKILEYNLPLKLLDRKEIEKICIAGFMIISTSVYFTEHFVQTNENPKQNIIIFLQK